MPLETGRTAEDTERFAANFRDELGGAALADAERELLRRDLFKQLAQAESNHALGQGGRVILDFRPRNCAS